MSKASEIGIDTLKLHLSSYKLKSKDIDLDLQQSSNHADNNTIQVMFEDTGEIDNYSHINYPRGDYVTNFKKDGALTIQVSAPKLILGSNTDLATALMTKQAIEKVYDELSDKGISFNTDDFAVSRLDITRNYDLNNKVSEYTPLIGMLPRIKNDFMILGTRYQQNKSFALCAYDKIQDILDKKDYLSKADKSRNLLRIESRLLKKSKLRTDTKKAGYDLTKIDTITSPDKFDAVREIYLYYMSEAFKLPYQHVVEQEKNKEIERILMYRKAGYSPLNTLARAGSFLCSIDEICQHLFDDRRLRHRFKSNWIKNSLDEKTKGKYSELLSQNYEEIRSLALVA